MGKEIDASDATVWVNYDRHMVLIASTGWGRPKDIGWCDPIGSAYDQWQSMTDDQRMLLMMETAIELATRGFDMAHVLREFATVRQFRHLGSKSYPMCRALTKAILGKSYEMGDSSFEQLLHRHHARAE